MRRRKKSLDNRGASLLAVLIVLVVVSAIGVVATKLTIRNIQMKEVERAGKTNLYSADSVVESLRAGAGKLAAAAMEQAYKEVMESYTKGSDLQAAFAGRYMAELEDVWSDGSAKNTSTENGATVYSAAAYDAAKAKSCIADTAAQAYFMTEAADAVYEADYKAGVFTLKNIKVVVPHDDYETTITTDLVFTTPEMNFSGGDTVSPFMRYSLIADESILFNASNVSVSGNAYAGAGGIETATSAKNCVMNGQTIITRGDVTVNNDAGLTIGAGNTSLWAENIKTQGKGASPVLTLAGNCYVADDLSLDGTNSVVTLTGSYYGYNFQENYDVQAQETDAQFSSAMMINAVSSKLDLSGLDYLMLAGRTFLARGSGANGKVNSDVMLGESLSVRTNQLAYYVPSEYVDGSTLLFTKEGLAKFEEETGISDVDSYLLPTQQLAAYYYIDRTDGSERVNYYLNFASEAKANAYFAAYASSKKADKVRQYASKYVTDDALILDGSRLMTLSGDILYRTKEAEALGVKSVLLGTGRFGKDSAYWNYCASLAVKYKALQLSLTETNTAAAADNVRLLDASGSVDKTVLPLFETLVDTAALAARAQTGTFVDTNVYAYEISAYTAPVVLVDNPSAVYRIPDTVTSGIVVATGDVYVGHDFNGLILSGGTIEFAANVSVTADEALVSGLFSADASADTKRFSDLFKTYNGNNGAAADTISPETYINYENWTRN